MGECARNRGREHGWSERGSVNKHPATFLDELIVRGSRCWLRIRTEQPTSAEAHAQRRGDDDRAGRAVVRGGRCRESCASRPVTAAPFSIIGLAAVPDTATPPISQTIGRSHATLSVLLRRCANPSPPMGSHSSPVLFPPPSIWVV